MDRATMTDQALPGPATLTRFLRSRRSVRRFQSRAVQSDTLLRILETAGYAPSAHNRQPWRFVVLTGPAPKSSLGAAMAADFRRDLAADGLPEAEVDALVTRAQTRLSQAPVVVLLCMDASEMDSYPDQKRQAAERSMALQSTALAGLQLQLAAHAEGLTSVWVCAPLFAPETVRRTLDLPETWEPQAMFFVGYPDGEAKQKELKPLNEIVKFL